MLRDWTYWLSEMPTEQLALLLLPMLLLDMPRYAFGTAIMWLWDVVGGAYQALRGTEEREFTHCPSVCIVIAGLNEADTIGHGLSSVWGTYPDMEIIVVDDGSSDGMAKVANEFAAQHDGVLVLRRTERGGKSSALNMALPFTEAEIIVCVDADSHLEPNAVWEIVQPFQDPGVGAVSGTVIARNAFVNLVTWLQAFEYLRCIFVGRMFSSRLGILGIVSGALGAFRKSALERVKGWDVGPGEDGDMSLKLRKAGYRIVFAPYSQCLTNLPTRAWTLIKQRRRWEWAVVTFECRKHVDLVNPLSANFQFSNLCMVVSRWLSNVIMPFVIVGYSICLLFHIHENTWKQLLLYYLVYVALDVFQTMVILYYSLDRRRDLIIGLVTPLMPIYHAILRVVSLWAVFEEAVSRRSFRDNFVPPRVREATWHW